MTRDEILAMPASELAEVSARMMGGKDLMFWFPTEFHDHARKVADWVCDQWPSLVPKLRENHGYPNAAYAIQKALTELTKSEDFHWAWTAEELTRAALLAFVDAGGER